MSTAAAVAGSPGCCCWLLAPLVAAAGPPALPQPPGPVLPLHPLTLPPSHPPAAQFLIGGDGPKRPLLQRVVEEHGLEGRVAMVGAVPHERVRELLVQGRIFLNCSLTEAFCMALVEAAAAGGCVGREQAVCLGGAGWLGEGLG